MPLPPSPPSYQNTNVPYVRTRAVPYFQQYSCRFQCWLPLRAMRIVRKRDRGRERRDITLWRLVAQTGRYVIRIDMSMFRGLLPCIAVALGSPSLLSSCSIITNNNSIALHHHTNNNPSILQPQNQ